jgi:hypothetical protein
VVVVAVALATLAVFAAEARAGSFGSEPPNAVLMKYKSVLQVAYSGGGLPYACNKRRVCLFRCTRMRLRLQAHPPNACYESAPYAESQRCTIPLGKVFTKGRCLRVTSGISGPSWWYFGAPIVICVVVLRDPPSTVEARKFC